jgi:hypothetical protein
MGQRGKPFEAGNRMGRGRPKGSRNRRSLVISELLAPHREELVSKAVAMALAGDPLMMRTLLPYMLERPGTKPAAIGPLPIRTSEDRAMTSDSIMQMTAGGQFTPTESRNLISIVEARHRLSLAEDVEQRVQALEDVSNPKKSAA